MLIDSTHRLGYGITTRTEEGATMETMQISRLCAQGDHMFCASCACTECHLIDRNGHSCRILYDGLCADCERARIRSTPTPPTLCDNDSSHGVAFRNPGHRKNLYLCMSCNIAMGVPIVLTAADLRAVVEPDCAGADVSDPRHSPINLHGSVWQCSRCRRRLTSRAKEVPVAWRRRR